MQWLKQSRRQRPYYGGAVGRHPGTPEDRHAETLAERARQVHRMLGERQEQMLPLLAAAGEHGATSGDIARALDYDQANATITLNAMVKAGLLLKDESAVPYRFRLVPELLARTDVADVGPDGQCGTGRPPPGRGVLDPALNRQGQDDRGQVSGSAQ